MKQTIKEKIRQRRSQMLVHSFLYYKLDDPIIDDDKWQRWANELAELQNNNPDSCLSDKTFLGIKSFVFGFKKFGK